MYARTSLISNGENAKIAGLNPYIYRCRNCDMNLTSTGPAQQYQRQKLIQNTVRVYSSLYASNLAALNAYQVPDTHYQVVDIAGTPYVASPGINWNQMSDRAVPHKQFATASGSTYGASSTKRTITRLRPGALSPGGSGVDIKHNSYDRYLNRLKGRGPVRRGVIPSTFGAPIPFNRAFPVYGGKTVKTAIVSNCNCPILPNHSSSSSLEKLVYEVPISNYQINNVVYQFGVGQIVFTSEDNHDKTWVKATIIEANEDGSFMVQYENGTTVIKTVAQLQIYYPCNCNGFPKTFNSIEDAIALGVCYDPNYISLKAQQ